MEVYLGISEEYKVTVEINFTHIYVGNKYVIRISVQYSRI